MTPSWHHSNVLKPQHHSPIRYWWGVETFSINGAAIRAWQSQEENKMFNVELYCQFTFSVWCLESKSAIFGALVEHLATWSLDYLLRASQRFRLYSTTGGKQTEIAWAEHSFPSSFSKQFPFIYLLSFCSPLRGRLTPPWASVVPCLSQNRSSSGYFILLLNHLCNDAICSLNHQSRKNFCCALGKLKFSQRQAFGDKADVPLRIILGKQNGVPAKWWLLCVDPSHWTCEC